MPSLLRLRVRELTRWPVVAVAFALTAVALVTVAIIAGAGGPVPPGVGRDPVAVALRVAAVPGGLVFGALAAVVVGADFVSSLERALLARDPRRLRYVRLQLATVLVLGLAWWLAQALVGVTAGLLVRLAAAVDPLERWAAGEVVWALLGVGAVTAVYGLLGVAAALLFRGGHAGVTALLAYALLGEVALAPLWKRALDWTLYDEAGKVIAAAGPPSAHGVEVLGGMSLLAVGLSLVGYVGREVRA
jgi:hypothetical protein